MSKLKTKRQATGLSQRQLAQRVGMSFRVLQAYEQGLRDINKAAAEMVYRLAVALGCTIEDLIDCERIQAENPVEAE